MATFRTTEKMRTARKAAMARLRAMSYEDILKHSQANQDSVTVAFLASCQNERPFAADLQQSKTVMREEFTVSLPAHHQGSYHSGSSITAAAVSLCAHAIQPLIRDQNLNAFATAA